jgi:hypothetical protein
MALLECPECGKSVSSTINSCIHCGYRLKSQATKPKGAVSGQRAISEPNETTRSQTTLRSIREIDAAAYPLVRFILFRPLFFATILTSIGLAVWFMVWTSPLLNPQCSALYDLGVQSAETSEIGAVFGYTCLPNYSGTILDNVQNITEGAIGYLKLSLSPLLLGIVCQIFGLALIGWQALRFKSLLSQFRTGHRPDFFGRLRELQKPILIRLFALSVIAIGALALMVWTFPLLGPRCAIFVQTSAELGVLTQNSGLTKYFDFVCLPLDPSLIDPDKKGPPAFVIGMFCQVLGVVLLAGTYVYARFLLRGSDGEIGELKKKKTTDKDSIFGQEPRGIKKWLQNHKSWWLIAGIIGLIAALMVASISLSASNTNNASQETDSLPKPSQSAEPNESDEPLPVSPEEINSLDSLLGVWERPSNSSFITFPEGLWLNIVKVRPDSYLAVFISADPYVSMAGIAEATFNNGQILFKWLDETGQTSVVTSDGVNLSLDCSDRLFVSAKIFGPDRCNFQGFAPLNLTTSFEEELAKANFKNEVATETGDGLAVVFTPKSASNWSAKLYSGRIIDTSLPNGVSSFVFLDLGYQQGLVWWGDEIPSKLDGIPATYSDLGRTGSGTRTFEMDCSSDPNGPYLLSDGTSSQDCLFFEDYVY